MFRFNFDQKEHCQYNFSSVELLSQSKFFLDTDMGLNIDLVNRQAYEQKVTGASKQELTFADEFLLSEQRSIVEFDKALAKRSETKSKQPILTS